MKSGDFLSLADTNSFRVYLKKTIKEIGDSLMIIIKPSPEATYRTTVDILDEMTLNNVKNYAMVKPADEEKSFLNTKGFSFEPTKPIEVKTPSSVLTQKIPENNAILIEIRDDTSIWYTIFATGQTNAPEKILNPVKEKLRAVIADYVKKYGSNKPQYLIKADPKITYPDFEKVIEALKQNNILKYNLVTSLENN